jgi:hypothetical protein
MIENLILLFVFGIAICSLALLAELLAKIFDWE